MRTVSGENRTDPIPPTIEWRRGAVRLIDQRALPARLRFLVCADVDALIDAITTLAVRGAPALGAAGAYGVALAAHTLPATRQVRAAAARTARARPTAVNLAWGSSAASTPTNARPPFRRSLPAHVRRAEETVAPPP